VGFFVFGLTIALRPFILEAVRRALLNAAFSPCTPGLPRLAAVLLAAGMVLTAGEPERSVIQIANFSQQPAYDAPWRFGSVQRSSGSGFVIRGKRIMTNAHVVSWAKQVLVRRYQDPRPYPARVVFIGHDCDLALLEVQDEGFFEGLEPLEFGEFPKVRSTVVTYGYPAGGEQISYTRGVVSRIEKQTYVHVGNRSFLAVQTDAAINPGNSGGPVIEDEKVVGVAFQGVPGLENTGFFIPPPIITHFLKDIEDGRYDGFPQAGIRIAPLQSPAYRRFLKLPQSEVGARIDSMLPIATTTNLLRVDDVLLKVGAYAVGSDGTILYQGNRLQVGVAIDEVQHGGSVPVTLWREGAEITLSLPVNVNRLDRAEGNQYDLLPRYLVYAGLVFTPLSRDYLRNYGSSWGDGDVNALVYELHYRRDETPTVVRTEPIVLAAVLPHAVNANLTVRGHALVDKINGVRIEKLEDVVQALAKADGATHALELLPGHSLECLDRAEADKAGPEILKTYGIPQDRRL
jgi:S1-C subfamily serine protease